MENKIELRKGDCLELMKDIKNKSIDCIITDPPYGMDFQSNHRKQKHIKIKNDVSLDWLPLILDECNRVLKNNTHFYMFCSYHNLDIFMSEVKKRFTLKNLLIWEKNNTSMGDLENDYAPKYEIILFIQKGKKKLNGSRKPNIMKYTRTGNNYHPTEKPLELIRELIRNSTNKHDLILDCFMGSGTTAVACKELNRDFIGIEIEPIHYETAKERIKKVNTSLSIFN